MTKRKKRIYLSLIGICALGLMVDRLATPAASKAAPAVVSRTPSRTTVESASPKADLDPADAPPAAVIAAARFPEKLAEFDLPARDLFAPTQTARRSLMGQSADAGAAPGGAGALQPEQVQILAERFLAAHTLSAVVHDPDFAVAILDGAWVRIGEQIDGCTLVRVAGRGALFDCGGASVELSVDRAPPTD